jgi:hypothetical protein
MLMVKSRSEAERAEIPYTTADGCKCMVYSFFDKTASDTEALAGPGPGVLYPSAFRVSQLPGTVAGAHFHQVDQFQLFVSGSGTFGKAPVHPFRLEYAGAFTPYGPIRAGDDGVSYLTLRHEWDAGLKFMPAEREFLKTGKRKPRAMMSREIDVTEGPSLASLSEPSCAFAIEPQPDGLGAWRYRIPPRGSITGPDPASGYGQYWVPLAGEDATNGDALPALSCVFLSADEPARTVVGGASGLDVLVIQFPYPHRP